MSAPLPDYTDELWWQCWGLYFHHVQPDDGPMCERCAGGQTPRDGCEEGVRLYDAYRLARIARGEDVPKVA